MLGYIKYILVNMKSLKRGFIGRWLWKRENELIYGETLPEGHTLR